MAPHVLYRSTENHMKIRSLILSAVLFTWPSSASAQIMTEITGRQWMASDKPRLFIRRGQKGYTKHGMSFEERRHRDEQFQ
jgi:hypothetical protein